MSTTTAKNFTAPIHSSRLVYLRDLLRELVGRDMKIIYKRSSLGILWSLINPLMQLIVFSFLIHRVLSQKIDNYSSYAFSGMLAWTWFSTALSQSSYAITGNRELVRRPGFPIPILPAVTVTTSLINFLIGFPILILFLALNGTHLTIALLALPIIIALQFLFTLSLAYLIAAVNVAFRDMQHLLGVALQLLFYMTPIWYKPPKTLSNHFTWVYHLNPMAHIIGFYRTILLDGRMPDWLAVAKIGALALTLLVVGYQVFARMSDRFVEEL